AAEKTGYLRPADRKDAANLRYTTTDEPQKTLSAVHAGASRGKTGIAGERQSSNLTCWWSFAMMEKLHPYNSIRSTKIIIDF
ncbi:hypothetical protein, partial [Desulfobulbus propionicus]